MASINLPFTSSVQAPTPIASRLALFFHSGASSKSKGPYLKNEFGTVRPMQPITINVVDYGARGDGATDDTAAINSAIAAANAFQALSATQRGCIVFFPAGIYLVSAALTTINANGIVLLGEGRGATTILVTALTGDIVSFTAGNEYCEVRAMQFFSSVARSAGAFINTSGAHDMVIQDLVMASYFTGINVSGSSIKVHIDRVVITTATQTTSVGILVGNGLAGDTYISNVIMSNGATAPTAGIRIQQTGHTSIHNCNITKADIGLLIDPATSNDVSYVFVDTCLFDSCVSGALKLNPANSATARIRSAKFVNSWFSGSTGSNAPGLNLTTQGATAIVDDVSFHACRILNNGGNGVTYGFGTNFLFDGCTIAGNSATSSGTLDGINVAANITDFGIRGCRIGPVGTATNTQRWAINIVAGTSNRFRINGNDLRGNVTGSLSQNGTGLIYNISTDNIGLPMDGSRSTAASAAINTTETVIALVPMGSNGINPGTCVEFVVSGTCTSTVANLSTFSIRLGVNGTTADTVIATFTITAAAAGASIPFVARIRIQWPTGNGSVTPTGEWELLNTGVTGIAAVTLTVAAAATTAAVTTVTADNILSLAYKTAATTTTSTFTADRQGTVKKAA